MCVQYCYFLILQNKNITILISHTLALSVDALKKQNADNHGHLDLQKYKALTKNNTNSFSFT